MLAKWISNAIEYLMQNLNIFKIACNKLALEKIKDHVIIRTTARNTSNTHMNYNRKHKYSTTTR